MPAVMNSLMGNSWAAACGALGSRITGFVRMAVAASVLGPTFFGNLFQTIAILPSTIYMVLIGSLISAVLVPPLIQRMNEGGRAEVVRLAGAVLGLTLVAMLSIGLLIALGAPMLLHALTVTVADPNIRSEQISLGLPLLLMLIPQPALYAVAGTGMAVQQAHGRFALAAFAPALENLINIAVLGASVMLFGIGTDLARLRSAVVAAWPWHDGGGLRARHGAMDRRLSRRRATSASPWMARSGYPHDYQAGRGLDGVCRPGSCGLHARAGDRRHHSWWRGRSSDHYQLLQASCGAGRHTARKRAASPPLELPSASGDAEFRHHL